MLIPSLPTVLALVATALPGAAPAADHHEDTPLLIRAERVLVRPGVELADRSVLVRHGRIVAVGEDLAAPEGARELEAPVVCAGFVDAWSSLGIDPRSVGAGDTSPATRSVDALDPYSQDHLRRDALAAGVTALRVQAGRDARLGGFGALVRNSPEPDPERDVVLPDACSQARVRGDDAFERLDEVGRIVGAVEKGLGYRRSLREYERELAEWEEQIAEKREELEDDFKKAKKEREEAIEEAEEEGEEFEEERYREERKPRKPNADIRALLEATERFTRLRLVLAGAEDALPFAEQLAERGVPVLLTPLPDGRVVRGERTVLELAAALSDAGVEVLFGTGGRSPALPRDLPLLAALGVGHGLAPEAALHALTLGPARALDAADRLGTVEAGKHADLLLLSGDPLATTTRVEAVVVGGRVVHERD